MFGHEFGEPVWILGIINNTNKDFRLEIANSRDTNTIKAFISWHVKKGNKICTDGWPSYDYLNEPDSGYIRYKHNHDRGTSGMVWSPPRMSKVYGRICKLLSKILTELCFIVIY